MRPRTTSSPSTARHRWPVPKADTLDQAAVDTVRSISATRSPGSLVSVTLASGERYQVSSARVAELGLAAGDELDVSKLEALRQAHTLDRAEQRLLRLLGTRARSRHELADRLDAWGVEPERGELLLDRLTRAGLLDDEQFARELSDGLQKRGHGTTWIGWASPSRPGHGPLRATSRPTSRLPTIS